MSIAVELIKNLKPAKPSPYSKRTRNTIIYTRVSSKEQALTNQSLETQKKHCLQYALNHDLNVIRFYGGTYESAKTDERKEFNRMMQQKAIAESMSGWKTFRDVFQERSAHRIQFDALNVNYYYDKGRCKTAANQTLKDIIDRPSEYESVFGSELSFVTTMLQDLLSQYNYDYNDRKFVWRDKIIYQKLLDIHASGLTKFVYVVGEKHTYKGSSSHRLGHEETSPLKGRVVLIKSTGKKSNGTFQEARELTRLSHLFPEKFCMGCHVIIRNDSSSKLLTQDQDYTIAFKNNEHVKRFKRTFVRE